MRQGAPISALIKPIGLCGTQKAPKNFQTRSTIFDPPLPHRSSDGRLTMVHGNRNFATVGGGTKIVDRVRKCFGAFWVPHSPIGLISAEIGAPCRIPRHATEPA